MNITENARVQHSGEGAFVYFVCCFRRTRVLAPDLGLLFVLFHSSDYSYLTNLESRDIMFVLVLNF